MAKKKSTGDFQKDVRRELLDISIRMGTKADIMRLEMDLRGELKGLREEVVAKTEKAKEEILETLRPIEKAVDKDAVTTVKHDKRIARIETHLSLK